MLGYTHRRLGGSRVLAAADTAVADMELHKSDGIARRRSPFWRPFDVVFSGLFFRPDCLCELKIKMIIINKIILNIKKRKRKKIKVLKIGQEKEREK